MKKTKILVTGLNGFIGSRFKTLNNNKFNIIGFKHSPNKSIMDINYVSKFVATSDPDLILHFAAKAHIEKCENDRLLGKKSQSWQINVVGTKNIARAANRYNKYLLFLSTECVFDGKLSWYNENNQKNPINWYGNTKSHAENEVLQSGGKFCILRSTLAYGHPNFNQFDLFHIFLNKFKNNQKFYAVNNQHLSLTYIDDLIKAISILIQKKALGIYHYAGLQSITPFNFAKIIAKKFKKSELVIPISLKKYFGVSSNLRLKNATLSSAKIKKDFRIFPSDLEKGIETAFSNL